MKFHSLFGSGVKVWSVFVWTLLFYSCSPKMVGFKNGEMEAAYYPRMINVPGLPKFNLSKQYKRTRILKKDWELIDLHHDISNQRFKNDGTGARTVRN